MTKLNKAVDHLKAIMKDANPSDLDAAIKAVNDAQPKKYISAKAAVKKGIMSQEEYDATVANLPGLF